MSLTEARSILGVQSEDTFKEIKSRFRALAMQHHPDRGGDPQEFKRVADAYYTLANWDKTDIVASGIESDVFEMMWNEWFERHSPEEQDKITEALRELEREE